MFTENPQTGIPREVWPFIGTGHIALQKGLPGSLRDRLMLRRTYK